MVDYSSASLPPPKDWQEFERCCRVLFECILEDPNTQLNGRPGQRQNGVDVYGRRGGDGTQWVGIQCKGKDGSTYNNFVTENELRAEVEKALHFTPRLSEFIIVTTAHNDAKIQRIARQITEENIKTNCPMTVNVWGWEDLQSRINQYPVAITAFHPDKSSYTDDILSSQSKIEIKLDSGFTSTSAQLEQIVANISTLQNTIDSSVKEKSALDSHLHAEVDTYRDLVIHGKPKTGMELLEKLKGKIWENTSNRIKFRITTNIGAALLRLGDNNNSANMFLSAIEYDPFDKIGMANVALAYLLLNDSEKAIKAANDAIAQNPENDDAAGYLIQAYFNDPNINDPFSLIPESLWEKRGTLASAITFWRKRNNPEWRKIADKATALFPEADEFKRAAAEAHLDAVSETKWILLGNSNAPDEYVKNLNDAASVLQSLWDVITIGEDKADISLPHNLAMAYRILGKYEEGSKVTDEALVKAPDDAGLIKLRAIFYVDLNQKEKALALLLKKRGSDPESTMLAAELLLGEDPKKARELLSEICDTATVDEYHVPASLMRIESYHREGDCEESLKQVKRLAAEYPQKIEVIIALSNIQRSCGDAPAEQTLLNAKNLIREESSFLDRFLVARELHYWGHHKDAVAILDGHIDFERDTPALQLFLAALKDSDRRRQAYECINKLSSNVAEKPWYLKMRVWINIARGDYKSAEKDLDKYFLLCPDDLALRHTWIGLCYRRTEGMTKIKAFLESNVEALNGNPVDQMQLAIYLDRFGFEERALQLGYKIFIRNPDRPDVHDKYVALLLQPKKTNKMDLHIKEICPDAVFTMENNRGESDYYLIEKDKQLKLDGHTIAPDHEIAQKVMGLVVGSTFKIDNLIGPPEEWQIKSVKHKYLDALHNCMERFNRQFPSYQGFQKVRFDPNEPETILAPVKARHDAFESKFKQFDETPVPLSIFAEILGIDDIKALQGIIEMGRKFRVCMGTAEERAIAFKAIKNNANRGCVTDALTFFLIRRLQLEDIITNVCGAIGITESSIDIFRQRLEEIKMHGGNPFMVLSFHNGKYIREEISEERLRIAHDEVMHDLLWIENNCDILPAESNLELLSEFSGISKRLGRNIFDSILAAHSSQRILLSEDYLYRTLAAQHDNLQAIWLQPLLMYAHDKHIITDDKFDNAIIYMLECGFDFISVDPGILLRASSFETDLSGKKFNKLAEALGGPTADMASHTRVVVSFLRKKWKGNDPSLVSKAQTSKLLECLLRGRSKDEFWAVIRMLRLSVISPGNIFQNYLIDWLKGHFYLPFE